MKKLKVPKFIFNFAILLIVLIGLWFLSEISSNLSIKGRDPTNVGHIVFHKGTIYFIEGENITASDLENFSDEDVMFRFGNLSIIVNGEMKLIGKGIKSGDRVAIWYDEVLESYPAQIKIIQIEKR
ncbi:DUF3221 domain-containing protein [Sutcliffiella cohnii]